MPPLTQVYVSRNWFFDAFGGGRFISNIGQYNDSLTGFGSMGKILYGYEGLKMPVLFTPRGLIHLQRSTVHPAPTKSPACAKKGNDRPGYLEAEQHNPVHQHGMVNANRDRLL